MVKVHVLESAQKYKRSATDESERSDACCSRLCKTKSLLCPACCLEIREKALDCLLYRLTRFHRCNFDPRLGRLAGFHLEHCILERHLSSEREMV